MSNVMPPLSPEEFSALKADIGKRGVLVPVEVDAAGIIDGHHRVRACEELGIADYPRLVRPGLDEDARLEHGIRLNVQRRHLSREQRQALVATLRERGWTHERIGEVLGVSIGQTHADASSSELNNSTARVTGKDGKSYPARKPRKAKGVLAQSAAEEEQAVAAATSAAEDLPDGVTTAKRAARIGREASAKQRDAETPTPEPSDEIDVDRGDIRELELPEASVDMIFTDPPYPAEYLPLWNVLGELAAHALKPGCLLVAYSGQFHFAETFAALAKHLDYFWLGGLFTPGQHNQVHQRGIRSAMKPLLFFARPPHDLGRWFDDAYVSEAREKDDHHWQQSLGCARYFIERLTLPGDLVVDPFLGSGTSAVAAHTLGRRFIGRDTDEAAIDTTKRRLAA